MLGSLFAGISGLNANALAMTVIGDNIANVNTSAFKGTRSSFANILSQSLQGSIGNEIGRGVQFWGTSPTWSQGSMENTNSPTDLAINGKGFFIVEDEGGTAYYTRAGLFNFDKDGYLTNPDGLFVQGYVVTSVNDDGTFNLGGIENILVPGESTSPPSASDEFSIDINLDAGAEVADDYTTSITVYDSLGNPIDVTLTFTNAGNGQWTVAPSIPASAGTGATIGGGASITLTFDENGELLTPATNPTISLALTNGAESPQDIVWTLYDDTGASKGDVTGYAAPSAVVFQTQNGYPSGMLRGIVVDENGVITGSYSNGQLVPLFQVALADFPSYYGLAKMGNNLYSESLASGQAMPGTPGSGRLGNISPNCLEMSNVDLASEFVKMITTQRAFQANSRVITTSDEILAELINIKR
jgi:flagellar hook protein FlgE